MAWYIHFNKRLLIIQLPFMEPRGRARMVVGFTTTYAASDYHH